MRVLVAVDTVDLGDRIVASVRRMGHAADWAREGGLADRMLGENGYDLAIIDLDLPEMDGAQVVRKLRLRRSPTAALALSARPTIDEKVAVLDMGADDYLARPFDFRELEARVRSLLRRRTGDRTNTLVCHTLAFDRLTRAASIGDEPLNLTRRELSALEAFMTNQSKIFNKTELIDHIFGYASEPTENAIEVIIARLRRKLFGSGTIIETHRGVGYRIARA